LTQIIRTDIDLDEGTLSRWTECGKVALIFQLRNQQAPWPMLGLVKGFSFTVPWYLNEILQEAHNKPCEN